MRVVSRPTSCMCSSHLPPVPQDYGQNVIRVLDAGVVSTFAGLAGTSGFVDGTLTAARFNGPDAIAVDASQQLYVCDRANNRACPILTPTYP